MSIQVAIVEDDEGIRESLCELIRRAPGCRLSACYSNAEAALEEIPRKKPHVVLMDINLPGVDGVECVRRLKPLVASTNFIMNTVYEDNDRLFESLRAGASGYLLKRTSSAKVLEAIREVQEGGAPMSPQLARRVVQHFQNEGKNSSEVAQLTPRERDVLDALAKGYLYKEITGQLGISLDTVRDYIRKIYEKLQVHSRTEAVLKYLKR